MLTGQKSTLVVVDGHNFTNDIGRALVSQGYPGGTVRTYLENWFDIDRFVEATLGQDLLPSRDLGIVVFRSRKTVGETDWRPTDTEKFWARQSSNPNTSTVLFEVPGSTKDDGMDVAIVVYLFETMRSWDSVVLFSNDADFVPAVASLRRQGKRVFCSSHTQNRVTPLVSACQHFYAWAMGYLKADIEFYRFVQPGAGLDGILSSERMTVRSGALVIDAGSLTVRAGLSGFDGNDENDGTAIGKEYGLMVKCRASNEVQIVHANFNKSPAARVEHTPSICEALFRHRDAFDGAEWVKMANQFEV